MAFKLSAIGRDTLRRHEGVVPYVYDDKRGARYKPKSWSDFVGFPTIGMGRLITPKDFPRFEKYLNGNPMPPAELEVLIEDTIKPREDQLNRLVEGVPLTQAMFDALFSMMYNTGAGNRSFKAAIAALVQRDEKGNFKPDYAAAGKAIADGPTTSKGQVLMGLVRRRGEEAARFIEEGIPGGAASLMSSRTVKLAGAAGLSLMIMYFVLRRVRAGRR